MGGKLKFSWQIFFTAFLLIVLALGIGGFLIVNAVFQSALRENVQAAQEKNRTVCRTLVTLDRFGEENGIGYVAQVLRMQQNADDLQQTYLFYEPEQTVYGLESGNSMRLNEVRTRYRKEETGYTVFVVSKLSLQGKTVFVQTAGDLSRIFVQRAENLRLYGWVILLIAVCGGGALMALSVYLTAPLRRITAVADAIAQGDYSRRIPAQRAFSRSQETDALAKSFNQMAQKSEEHMEELKRTAEQREEFVANFTHELKTPLTAIIGYADMLRSFDLSPEDRRGCSQYIFKEGKRLEALSLHLLDLFVMEKNSLQPQPVRTDLFVGEIKGAVAFLLEKYGITLRCQCASAMIYADPVMLKTLVYNLIDNACKASAPGSTVILSGKPSGERYLLALKDEGKGIPESELQKITEPFYMVDKSRSRKQGGAGLGLALCKAIAELHGSTLHFESEVGKGTIVGFHVALYTKELAASLPQEEE